MIRIHGLVVVPVVALVLGVAACQGDAPAASTTSPTTSPSPMTSPSAMTSASPTSAPTSAAADDDLFAKMPAEFLFASGAGAWGTEVHISPDGSFVGRYHDSEMAQAGPDYPSGTVYESLFSGKFEVVRKVGDLEYELGLVRLDHEGAVDEERIEDGIRYVTTEPYGFGSARSFAAYLPGTKTSDLPEGVMSWNPPTEGSALAAWCLYNAEDELAFFSQTS